MATGRTTVAGSIIKTSAVGPQQNVSGTTGVHFALVGITAKPIVRSARNLEALQLLQLHLNQSKRNKFLKGPSNYTDLERLMSCKDQVLKP